MLTQNGTEVLNVDNTEGKKGRESGVAITATIIRSQTLVSIAVRGRWYSCHDIASAAVTVRNATAPMIVHCSRDYLGMYYHHSADHGRTTSNKYRQRRCRLLEAITKRDKTFRVVDDRA